MDISQLQLAQYQDAYRVAKDRALRLADSLDHAQFNWKPAGDRWSVAECLYHLNVISERYLPVLREALERAERNVGGPFSYGWLSRKFIESVRPDAKPVPTGKAMKPPATTSTQSELPREDTIRKFGELMDQFVDLVASAEGADLAHVKVRSPFLWLLRLPVGAFLDALGQHALRHVGQAESVAVEPGFPGT